MKSKILHLMFLDEKFTVPLIQYLSSSEKFSNHTFLVVGDEWCELFQDNEQVIFLKNPLGKNWLYNLSVFTRNIYAANKIITHGFAFSYFFALFPRQIKKIIWMIHGYDIPESNTAKSFSGKLHLFVKKRILYHATHIKEDSEIVNEILDIDRQFVFSLGYLSNVCSHIKKKDEFIFKNDIDGLNILAGNSTSPSNQHRESFQIIKDSKIKINTIYSVLSYGIFEDYKNEIIEEGEKKFKDKFKPITDFLSLEAYMKLLDKIDVVIFNHQRQEAMGATLQLLSLGKPVFFNAKSPAYQSFKRRGYQVFDIDEIDMLNGPVSLDLSINRELLRKDYSMEQMDNFYTSL